MATVDLYGKAKSGSLAQGILSGTVAIFGATTSQSLCLGIIDATTGKYTACAQALLPQGIAWTREPDAELTKLLDALGRSFERVDQRADLLPAEANPATARELLADWEEICGHSGSGTIEERQAALAAHFDTATPSQPHLIEIAARYGFNITIQTYMPFQCGRSHCGDPIGERYVWAFLVSAVSAADPTAMKAAVVDAAQGHTVAMFDIASS